MGKGDVVHQGKRGWWSGKVTTLCGLTFDESCYEDLGWFVSVTCPACKRIKRGGK